MSEAPARRRKLLSTTGVLAGVLVGAATVALAGTATAHRLVDGAPQSFLEVTHLPPLLTAPGERVELRYDAYCATADEPPPTGPCEATGTVFFRSRQGGPVGQAQLGVVEGAAEGRLMAAIPGRLARNPTGFTYYAVIRSTATGQTVTLPPGGAGASQLSRPLLGNAVVATLAPHSFGGVLAPDARVAEASWGSGPGEVGLEDSGIDATPIGGSSFDVSDDGDVYLLDEANRRILRWEDNATTPSSTPLAITGTMADLSIAADGTIHVLEGAHAAERRTLVRSFAASGKPSATIQVADHASRVQIGPSGPVVFQGASGEWTSVSDGTSAFSSDAQRRSARSGRSLADGREVVVFRTGNEIRLALLEPGSSPRMWRVTSSTPIAEVQLADPLDDRLVVVVRTYTDQASEFVVLVLGPNGIEQQSSLAAADWAETAPVSRFRLRGSSLYQLGSTPDGVFVERFDLEVN